MSYSSLKEELLELAELCSTLPPKFQEKCFEVLLQGLLKDLGSKHGADRARGENPTDDRNLKDLIHKVAVEQFLLDYDMNIDSLKNVLAIAEGGTQVQVRRNPPPGKKAKQQIDWSLLLALKTLVQDGKLSFRPADVREVCNDKACFDRSNWAANYQRTKAYFADDPVKSLDVRLSPTGREALALLIRSYPLSK